MGDAEIHLGAGDDGLAEGVGSRPALVGGGDSPADHPGPQDCIVVADDEQSLRNVVGRVLARSFPGLPVSLGENGVEGLAAIDEILGDLRKRLLVVISDQMMPEMRGEELYRVLRSRPGGKNVPFIMMSGWMPDDLLPEIESIKKGDPLFRFLDKPFTPQALKACIDELLALRREIEELSGSN